MTLYSDGVVLKRGAPPFKQYEGTIEGLSPNQIVADVLKLWGPPTSFYVRGTVVERVVVLEYKGRATLTVWRPRRIKATRRRFILSS